MHPGVFRFYVLLSVVNFLVCCRVFFNWERDLRVHETKHKGSIRAHVRSSRSIRPTGSQERRGAEENLVRDGSLTFNFPGSAVAGALDLFRPSCQRGHFTDRWDWDEESQTQSEVHEGSIREWDPWCYQRLDHWGTILESTSSWDSNHLRRRFWRKWHGWRQRCLIARDVQVQTMNHRSHRQQCSSSEQGVPEWIAVWWPTNHVEHIPWLHRDTLLHVHVHRPVPVHVQAFVINVYDELRQWLWWADCVC